MIREQLNSILQCTIHPRAGATRPVLAKLSDLYLATETCAASSMYHLRGKLKKRMTRKRERERERERERDGIARWSRNGERETEKIKIKIKAKQTRWWLLLSFRKRNFTAPGRDCAVARASTRPLPRSAGCNFVSGDPRAFQLFSPKSSVRLHLPGETSGARITGEGRRVRGWDESSAKYRETNKGTRYTSERGTPAVSPTADVSSRSSFPRCAGKNYINPLGAIHQHHEVVSYQLPFKVDIAPRNQY